MDLLDAEPRVIAVRVKTPDLDDKKQRESHKYNPFTTDSYGKGISGYVKSNSLLDFNN